MPSCHLSESPPPPLDGCIIVVKGGCEDNDDEGNDG